jgi:predicted HD phosphohydrolase
MDDGPLPTHESQNYDDKHETKAYAWLLKNFGQAVAEPVRLHVAAKRYLCTVDPDYSHQLSPTSLKSYFDQGGPMNGEEKATFERNPFYAQAVRLRRWDDTAKDPDAALPEIHSFAELMREVIAQK